MMSLVDRLRSRAAAHGDDVAFRYLADGRHESSRLTFRELDLLARRVAAALQRRQLSGPVLLLYSSSLEFVAAFYGCLYAGTLAVPVFLPETKRQAERIRAVAEDSGALIALTSSRFVPGIEAQGLTAIATDALPVGLEEGWRAPDLQPTDLAFLQYTSGSTDRPKGVMVSHGNLLANLQAMREAYGQDEASVFVSWLPLYHDLGLIGAVLHAPFVGASCVLMPPEAFLHDPFAWLSAMTRYGGTISGGPNFAYDLCLRRIPPEQRGQLSLERWQVAINGAEPVFAETLERFAAAFAPAGFEAEALHPCYGLAEATLLVAGRPAGRPTVIRAFDPRQLQLGLGVPESDGKQLVGCGQAFSGHRLQVVDPESGVMCGPGQVGEIWVAGPSVAHGYWRRPNVSAETFAARLAHEGPYLRTGDLGFLDTDGELFVTGRCKDLLVIRGVNHYPQDIERTVAMAHPAVRPGGVAAFALPAEGTEGLGLVVEVKATDGLDEDVTQAIVRAVQDRHDLAPQAIALVDPGSVPKTTSGKIRRSACRERFADETLRVRYRWSAPVSRAGAWPTRDALARLTTAERTSAVASALADWVGTALHRHGDPELLTRPLTTLGGDSLLAVELVHEIDLAWQVGLGFSELLGDMSLGTLAHRLSERMEKPSERPPIESVGLSAGQEAFWFTQCTHPDAGLNHLAVAIRLRGRLDAGAVQSALDTLVARHPALRTVYSTLDGTPRILDPQSVGLLQHEARGITDLELRDRLEQEAHQPFALDQGVLRASLYRQSHTQHVLLVVLHHLAADMWSLSLLMDELLSLYRTFSAGEWPNLVHDMDPPGMRELTLEREQALRAYWQGCLAGELSRLDLPFDRMPGATRDFEARRLGRRLKPSLVRVLKEAATAQQTTLAVVLLAAYQVFLGKLTGQSETIVGVPMAGRSEARLAKSVGYFANVLPIRAKSIAEAPFADTVLMARQSLLEALDHQDLPLARIIQTVHAERPNGAPLFQTLFVFEQPPSGSEVGALLLGAPGARLETEGLTLESFGLHRTATEFDLTLAIVEDRDGLYMVFDYPTAYFDEATIRRFLRYFDHLLRGVARDFERPIASLSLLTRAEQETERTRFRSERVPVPPMSLHGLFEKQAAQAPEATALISGTAQITYGELDQAANRLASRLIARGLGVEDIVGVLAETSVDLVIGILGILKGGGAYLPLDPELPTERLQFMLEDAGTRLLLIDGPRGRTLTAVPALEIGAAEPDVPPTVPTGTATPDQLAYVLYTSGSTGRPKGVLVPHQGLVSHTLTMAQEFGFTREARCLQYASPAFDSAALEIFFTLATGGTLVLADRAIARDPRALEACIAAHGVTTAVLPPAMLALLRPETVSTLQAVVSAGETCPRAVARRWSGIERFFNGYGPTEATVGATAWRMPVGWQGDSVPIGRPFPNVDLYLLDAHMQPVPAGVIGEIYLGGAGLARGYRTSELEAEAFVPNPFAPGRLYRTRDLARCLPDGNLEFKGRVDRQLKLRGQRLEPAEIESVLKEVSGVQDAAVDLKDGRLVAFLVPNGQCDLAVVKRAATRKLPRYMVPTGWVWLEQLPLTASGKIDRARLPVSGPATGSEEPQDEVERALAGIWAEVLDLPSVGRNDNFFELGGHSLQSVEVLLRVLDSFGRDLPASSLFKAPSVAEFAELLQAELPAPSEQPGELTDLQQAYWVGAQPDMALGVPARGLVELACPDLDAVRLAEAWNRLVARHPMLRASVSADGALRITERPRYHIAWHHAPGPEALERLKRGLLSEARKPDHWPMFELVGVRHAAGACRLLLAMDLLIADGWSLHGLFEELSLLYADPAASLPPVAASFQAHLSALAAVRQGSDHERAWAYWQQRIDTLPPGPELPYAELSGILPRFERLVMRLEAEHWQQFQAAAATAGLTPTAALCAAFCEVLSQWSRDPHFTLNLMFFNRPVSMAQVVGNFSTTSLLEVDRTGSVGFEQFARQLQERMHADLAHSEVSGVRVAREISRHRPAAFPVVFASTLGMPDRSPPIPIGTVAGSALQTPQVLLDHQVIEEHGGLTLNWDVVTAAFLPGVPEAMAVAYLRLIERLCMDAGAWQAVPTDLLPPEQAKRHASLNQSGRELPFLGSVLADPLRLQATHRPHQIAVIAGDRKVTYRDLFQEAAGLAAALRAAGCRPGRPVGVLVEKGLQQVVAVLAAIEAGCAYLPLDVAWPPDRLTQVLTDAGVEVAIVSDHAEALAPWSAKLARVAVSARDLALKQAPGARPEDPAYVLYTSGTSGRPKGVAVSHAAVLNTLSDMVERFSLGPDDRVLALSSMTFDLSVFDLFATLAVGGTLVLPDAAREREPRYLHALMAKAKVSVWNSVPAWMQLLMGGLGPRPQPLDALRLVLLSGDWIPLALPDRIRELAPSAELVGLGGATEAAIWSILHPLGPQDASWSSVPYGRPMANQRFYVLDDKLRQRPDWVPGELYIGGAGLAIGYWQDAERTTERFVIHPITHERLYRTGDQGRHRPEGVLEFMGRLDTQVKIQGYRIETAEIEHALEQHPGVSRAVVVAVRNAHGGHLVAYWTADEGAEPPTSEELEQGIRRRLPAYMVPRAYHQLERMPLTANGKLDRRTLPSVVPAVLSGDRPLDELEQEVADLWREVLGMEVTSAHARFLEMGGDSLAAVHLLTLIRERYDCELPVTDLLANGTVAQMASALRDQRPATSRLVPLGGDPAAAAFIAVHPVGGGVLCYADLARELGVPMVGIQADGWGGSGKAATSIEAMAASYVDELLALNPVDPLPLGGWSMGGVIAYEMAQVLGRMGRYPEVVVLIDSPMPGSPTDPLEALLGDLAARKGGLPEDRLPSTAAEAWEFARRYGLLAGMDRAAFERLLMLYTHHLAALHGYRPQPYAGRLVVLTAQAGAGSPQWEQLATGTVELHELPGTHHSLLETPHRSELARIIASCLQRREAAR